MRCDEDQDTISDSDQVENGCGGDGSDGKFCRQICCGRFVNWWPVHSVARDSNIGAGSGHCMIPKSECSAVVKAFNRARHPKIIAVMEF